MTRDVEAAVKAAKGGQAQFRAGKNGVLHIGVGKVKGVACFEREGARELEGNGCDRLMIGHTHTRLCTSRRCIFSSLSASCRAVSVYLSGCFCLSQSPLDTTIIQRKQNATWLHVYLSHPHHFCRRQVSFERSDLIENVRATMVAISNLKPEIIKGKYISQVRRRPTNIFLRLFVFSRPRSPFGFPWFLVRFSEAYTTGRFFFVCGRFDVLFGSLQPLLALPIGCPVLLGCRSWIRSIRTGTEIGTQSLPRRACCSITQTATAAVVPPHLAPATLSVFNESPSSDGCRRPEIHPLVFPLPFRLFTAPTPSIIVNLESQNASMVPKIRQPASFVARKKLILTVVGSGRVYSTLEEPASHRMPEPPYPTRAALSGSLPTHTLPPSPPTNDSKRACYAAASTGHYSVA